MNGGKLRNNIFLIKSLNMLSFLLILALSMIKADPVPTGGANCTNNDDCGGTDGGKCVFNETNDDNDDEVFGTCECPVERADVDCSYERHDGNVAGGLSIGLAFVYAGCTGNFYYW